MSVKPRVFSGIVGKFFFVFNCFILYINDDSGIDLCDTDFLFGLMDPLYESKINQNIYIDQVLVLNDLSFKTYQ